MILENDLLLKYLLKIMGQGRPQESEAEELGQFARYSMSNIAIVLAKSVEAKGDRDAGYKVPFIQSARDDTIIFGEKLFFLD